MQAIQQKHAQAVYEAHVLALKTLTDLIQRETDPIEQRRIAAIILRTKPTPPRTTEEAPALPRPRPSAAKPSLRPSLPKLPPLDADLDDEADDDLSLEDDDDLLDARPFTPRDLETLRHLMAAAAATPPAQGAGEHHPSP